MTNQFFPSKRFRTKTNAGLGKFERKFIVLENGVIKTVGLDWVGDKLVKKPYFEYVRQRYFVIFPQDAKPKQRS